MTTPVRLVFFCMKGKLEYTHDISSSLLASWYLREDVKIPHLIGSLGYDAGVETSDGDGLSRALAPLMAEHEESCRAASPTSCRICGRDVKIHPLFTPVSIDEAEHDDEDCEESDATQDKPGDATEYSSRSSPPTINIWVDRHCSRGKCKEQAQREAANMLVLYHEQVAMAGEEEVRWGKGVARRERVLGRECDECGKSDEVYFCHLTCEAAVYCGSKCQMRGWPRHKAKCMIGRW